MNFEFTVGWRYLKNRRSRIVAVVSWITVLGVAFAVTALLVTLAVVTGFEREYERSVLSFNAHVVVMHPDSVKDVEALIDKVQSAAQPGEIKGLTPFLYQEGLAVHGSQVRGVAIKAVSLSDYWRLSGLTHEQTGPDADGLWVGKLFRQDLDLKDAPLRVRIPSLDDEKLEGSFQELPVAGFFSAGMYDYDSSFALVSLEMAREKLGLRDKFQGVEIWLHNPKQAEAFASRLSEILSIPYTVLSWQELNAHLFGALKLERLIFSIIMGILILVASFNITGTLTMRILEKRGDIAILRAMGARWSQIRRLFFLQGLFLGWFGGVLGLVLGLLGLELLERLQPLKLSAEIYFIEFVPSEWRLSHAAIVLGITTVFSWIATRLALLRLKRLSIVQALGEI